jgi:DNA polymerase III epsilon subunit-like protein
VEVKMATRDKFLMVFDTETGGLNPGDADLLTGYFGIVDESYQVVEELYLKLKPSDRLPIAEAGALKVNGIDIKAHLDDPETITYEAGHDKLVAMLKKYSKKTGRSINIRPMGYNVPFDIKWVQHHLLFAPEWENLLHYKHVDVMQNVDFLKDCGWFPQDLGSLGTVVDYLQLPKRSAHNAKEDSLMTLDLHKKLLEIMDSKKEGGQAQDLISLLEAE